MCMIKDIMSRERRLKRRKASKEARSEANKDKAMLPHRVGS